MDTMRICKECGKALPENAPEGLCPACLAKVALGSEPAAPGATININPLAGQAVPGTRVPPEVAQLAPQFPQLEIIELLGMGGMGMVYKARQPRLDRFVALKILPVESAQHPSFAERFNREAKALAKLNHPGIVAVYDFGQTGQYYYFVMEYVDGMNLRRLLNDQPVTPRQALELVVQICTALQYAHDKGVVHRDIKPENILINKEGQVKIADFGLAKLLGAAPDTALTMSQAAMGTFNYMAPEQRENAQKVDHRADIYSLGVVFYEMLTGEVPMGRFEPPSKKVQIDVRLDEVVLKALEREPARRYQQVSEVKSGVETIASTKPAPPAALPPVAPSPVTVKADHFWRRLVLVVLALIAIPTILALFVGLLVAMYQQRGAQANQIAAQHVDQEGWQLLQQGKFDDARKRFTQVVEQFPANVDGWNGLGWTWLDTEHPQVAETNFQKALSLDANCPGALNGLGQIYLSQRNYEAAEKDLLQAASKESAAWYGLARLYLLEGKFDSAKEWAQKLVDSGQANDTARQMLKAAQEKHVSDELRRMIEPPPHGDKETHSTNDQ